jgi:peptidoglycan/LPS O-acetylase OafA/YrhL
MATPGPARNQSLDILRFAAVLLVFAYHFQSLRIGWAGVDLFFVLSGFLISGLLFQEYKATGCISFKSFFWRRALKIWPPAYALLGLMTLLYLYFAPIVPWKDILATCLFIANYVPQSEVASRLLGHLWSLSVEEHFYIALPLLLVFLAKKKGGPQPFASVPFIFAGVAFACLSLRILAKHGSSPTFLIQTHLRIDSLFAGVFVSYLYHFKKAMFDKLSRTRSMLIAIVCFLPAIFFERASWIMQTFGLTAVWISFSILVAWAIGRNPSGSALLPARVGFYSYSIYLWHVVCGYQFASMRSSTLVFCLGFGVAIIFGVLMSKIVEWPCLALRNKWFPGQGFVGAVHVKDRSQNLSAVCAVDVARMESALPVPSLNPE